MKELCDWMVVMVAQRHWTMHLKYILKIYFITIKKTTTKGKTSLEATHSQNRWKISALSNGFLAIAVYHGREE